MIEFGLGVVVGVFFSRIGWFKDYVGRHFDRWTSRV